MNISHQRWAFDILEVFPFSLRQTDGLTGYPTDSTLMCTISEAKDYRFRMTLCLKYVLISMKDSLPVCLTPFRKVSNVIIELQI